MGSVYRPSYTGKDGRKRRYKTYQIAYVDERGKRVVTGGYRDKRASEEKLRKLEERVSRIRAGLPVEAEARSLVWEEGVSCYVAELRRLGRTGPYLKTVTSTLEKIAAALGWTTVAAIAREPMVGYLGQLSAAGRAPRTVNHYRDTLAAFATFAVSQGWIAANPITSIAKASLGSPGDVSRRPYAKRALTLEEFRALIATAPPRRGVIYSVAARSGLRARELSLLEKQDANFTPRPTWHLRPEITKGKRLDVVGMTPDCIDVFCPLWEAAAEPTTRLFPRRVNHRTFAADLRRAGIQRLDHRGRRATFHSLRYLFCVRMGLLLPIQRVRQLMRHRDIRTTVNLYMDLGIADAADELAAELPRVIPPDAEAP